MIINQKVKNIGSALLSNNNGLYCNTKNLTTTIHLVFILQIFFRHFSSLVIKKEHIFIHIHTRKKHRLPFKLDNGTLLRDNVLLGLNTTYVTGIDVTNEHN